MNKEKKDNSNKQKTEKFLSGKVKAALSIVIVAAVIIPIGLWIKKVNSQSETYAYKETRIVTDGNTEPTAIRRHDTETETKVSSEAEKPKEETKKETAAEKPAENPADQLLNDVAYKKVTVDPQTTPANQTVSYTPQATQQQSQPVTYNTPTQQSSAAPSSSADEEKSTQEPQVVESEDEDGKKVYFIMYDKNDELSEDAIKELLKDYGIGDDADLTVQNVDADKNGNPSTNNSSSSSNKDGSSKKPISDVISDIVDNAKQTINGGSTNSTQQPSPVQTESQMTQEELEKTYNEATVSLGGSLGEGSSNMKVYIFGAPDYYIQATSWHIKTLAGSPALVSDNAVEATLTYGEGDECEVYVDVTLENGKTIRTNSKIIWVVNGKHKMFDTNYVSDIAEMESLSKVSQEGETYE